MRPAMLLNEFPTVPDRTGNAGAPAGSDGKSGEARLRVLRSGFRYSGTRPEIDHPLLLLGQHTDYGIWASYMNSVDLSSSGMK